MQVGRAQGLQHVDFEVVALGDLGRQAVIKVTQKALERIAANQVEKFSFELCKMTKSFGAKLEYAAGLGYKITIPQSRRHNVVIRIMQEGGERTTPYIRWSDRNGALNVLGESLSDLTKTHISLNSTTPEIMSELIKLILSK